MNKKEFAGLLKRHIRDGVIDDVFSSLSNPIEKKPSILVVQKSNWFKNLNTVHKQFVKLIMQEAVDAALFDVCVIFDGGRKVSEGKFELYHIEGSKRCLLNDPKDYDDLLHDYYNEAIGNVRNLNT